MFKLTLKKTLPLPRFLRSAISLSLILLIIEFYDEFYYAVGYTALPAIRSDLGLTYAQVGLLLGLPGIINTFIEPLLMLLGDTFLRKRLILGGGLGMAFTALIIAGVQSFPVLLLAEMLCFPSSGAFVTLSQATLMDLNPGREPHMMARWSVAGSLANLIGPLLLAGGFALALGWRWAYGLAAILGLALTMLVWKRPFTAHEPPKGTQLPGTLATIKSLLRNLWEALRNPKLLRWEALLLMSDLLLDVFTGYATLYFVDVVGLSQVHTALVLSLMMLAGLISDVMLIPLLERFNGQKIVRISATLMIRSTRLSCSRRGRW